MPSVSQATLWLFAGAGLAFCVIHMRQMVQEMWLTLQNSPRQEYLACDVHIFKSARQLLRTAQQACHIVSGYYTQLIET